MNCKNCGSDLMDGAKFCSICGTPVPVNDENTMCPSCGQTVPNKKFCRSCGAMLQAATPAPIKEEKSTLKAQPASEAQPAFTAPAPEEQPAFVAAATEKQPVFTAPGANPFDGYAQPTASPSGNENVNVQQNTDSFANGVEIYPNGFDAASSVAIKKSGSMKLPVILCSVALVLVAAFIIIRVFFWSSVTQLIMGESNYIKMIEGNGLKDVVSISSIAADTINSTAGDAVAAVSNIKDSYDASSISEIASEIAQGDVTLPSEYLTSSEEEQGLAQIYPLLYQTLLQYATSEGLSAEYSINAEIGDKLKPVLETFSANETVNVVIEYLNSLRIGYSMCGDDNGFQFSVNAKDAVSTLLDSVCVLRRDGKVYFTMPSVSNKAVYAELDIPETELEQKQAPVLAIDEKELEKLIQSFVDVYLAQLDKASTHIGETEKISVRNVEVSGKKITVLLTPNDVTEIAAGIVEKLRTNEYFKTTIVNFISETAAYLGETTSFNATDWDNSLSELSQMLSETKNESATPIEINTYVSTSNDIVGKEYNFAGEFVIKYVKSGSKTIISDENEKVTFVIDKKSDTNGSVEMFVKPSNTIEVGITLDYSDVKFVEFAGRDVLNGKFELYLSKDNAELQAVIEQGSVMLGNEVADLLKAVSSGMKFTFENKVSSTQVESYVKVFCDGYFNINAKQILKVGGAQMFDVSGLDLIDIENITDVEQANKLEMFVGEAKDYYIRILGENPVLNKLGLTSEALEELFAEIQSGAASLSVERTTEEELQALTALMDSCNRTLSDVNTLIINKKIRASSELYESYLSLCDEYGKVSSLIEYDSLSEKETYDVIYASAKELFDHAVSLYNDVNNAAEEIVIYSIGETNTSAIIEKIGEKLTRDNGGYNCALDYHVVLGIDEIMNALNSDEVPDIIIASSDNLADLSGHEAIATLDELGVSYNKNDYYDYTIDAATANGKTYALPFEMSPGVLYYRKDYASQYLGINSPEEMSSAVASWGQFIQLANRLKSASQGSVSAIATTDELKHAFMCEFDSDGAKLFNNDRLTEFYDTTNTLLHNGCIMSFESQWGDDWINGSYDNVMFYFGSTWYSALDSMTGFGNKDLWECCVPPEGYFYGGTWVCGTKSGMEKDYVKEAIECIAADKEIAEMRITEKEYTIPAIKSVLQKMMHNSDYDYITAEINAQSAEKVRTDGSRYIKRYNEFANSFIATLNQCLESNANAQEFVNQLNDAYIEYIGNTYESTDLADDNHTANENAEEDIDSIINQMTPDMPADVYNSDGSINYERYFAAVYGEDYVDQFKEAFGDDFDFSSLFQ